MLAKRLIKSNDAGGGACTNTVDLYNPFPDGGGVALYQLNGDATDVSGNYDGTASNVTYGAGQFGQAGVFNGSSSYVGIAENSWNSFTSYTLSAWIYDTGTATGGRTIASNYGYTAASNVEKGWIVMRVGTKLRISNSTTGLASTYLSTNDIPFNQWTNIVVTNTQSEIKIYFNGALDSTHSTIGFLNDPSWPMRPAIGVYRYDTTEQRNGYFSGQIDQVRIFSRALRPYEVEALYTEEYCTPTIVPSEHFNTVTWTGNGASSRDITSVGFQPDMVWIKSRTNTAFHNINDSVRGVNKIIQSNTTTAEQAAPNGGVSAYLSNGYTLEGASTIQDVNNSGQDFVAWNFKAGGAAVTNTDGDLTTQVSANTEAGFSIATYTGYYTGDTTKSIGHGLNTKPDIFIVKNRTQAKDWYVYTDIIDGSMDFLYLNLTNAKGDSTRPLSTNTVNYIGGASTNNVIGDEYVVYSFAEVEGFSNFGSYVGTGASGNAIVTGFEPAFVMVKQTNTARNWYIMDNKRNPENPKNLLLIPNTSDSEYSGSGDVYIDFLENGFEITASAGDAINQSGGSYIYMAFAADPTTIEPTLEDSFNTAIWNGGTPQSINVGFEPDLIWIKSRGVANNHNLADSVRGIEKILYSNLTNSEAERLNSIETTSTGFNLLDTWAGRNDASYGGYVGWAWKGAELPAINSNGSIPSVVSANPAAGFSIVSYTTPTNLTAFTLGHGLEATPSVIIVKDRVTNGVGWHVFHSSLSNSQQSFLQLNTTAAVSSSAGIWNNTLPTDSVFSQIAGYATAGNAPAIAYCFAEVAGFSKFGSYTGTGNSSTGATINCGFEPAFVMIKSIDRNPSSWVIHDNKRGNYNNGDIYARLTADSSDAEVDDYPTTKRIDISSTGFTITNASNSWNGSGYTYIYMAFANQF